MISRLLNNCRSKLDYAATVKEKVFILASRRTSKVFFGVGLVTSVLTYFYVNDEDYLVDEFPRRLPVTLYRILPLCQLSRMFGTMAGKEIPESLRGILLGSYVAMMGVDLSDAKITDLKHYKSLSDLFQRQLRWDSRPIDRESDLVSPCDGMVLHCGRANHGTIEQVKGLNFTIKGFLGADYLFWEKKFGIADKDKDETKQLFYCTLYLGPGDYHRFHAPTECDLEFRRYFAGKLLSVSPTMAKLIPGLFSVNERVVYFGKWKYGLFSYTAIGATNVGNIRIFSDRDLPTNAAHQALNNVTESREEDPFVIEKDFSPAIRLSRGQLFGEFNLGSSIVVLFEAPMDFEFAVRSGDKVKMGVALGSREVKMDSHNPLRQI